MNGNDYNIQEITSTVSLLIKELGYNAAHINIIRNYRFDRKRRNVMLFIFYGKIMKAEKHGYKLTNKIDLTNTGG
ncbi:MAG TPA: hypothetical protein ENI61_04270 [Ignavibacteria bacterium]|nr:hypothetical protein [Ignavibacteria bacterium]